MASKAHAYRSLLSVDVYTYLSAFACVCVCLRVHVLGREFERLLVLFVCIICVCVSNDFSTSSVISVCVSILPRSLLHDEMQEHHWGC